MLSSRLAAVPACHLLFYRLYSKDEMYKEIKRKDTEGASQGAPHKYEG